MVERLTLLWQTFINYPAVTLCKVVVIILKGRKGNLWLCFDVVTSNPRWLQSKFLLISSSYYYFTLKNFTKDTVAAIWSNFLLTWRTLTLNSLCFSRRLSTRPTAQELRERNILKCKHMFSFFSGPFFFYKINILGQLFVNEV